MSRSVLSSLAVALLIGAGPATEDRILTVQESLEGDWQMVYMESDNGTAMGDGFSQNFRMKCRGQRMWFLSSGKVWSEERYRLDPGRTPRAIDMTYLTNEPRGQTMRGIYRLEGDTLTLCWGKVRPSAFIRNNGKEQPVYVLKRIRK